ncbi:MAG TPA: methenyltetrahydromethanopterin cyclohydrolase [Pirellulales bacterium]|jgi:methenyltetrahydromethanopterin cyclohydrolase|nr:methenyltetrahydromethanopterin cyclohydrolase [Pirellulales bacterium]
MQIPVTSGGKLNLNERAGRLCQRLIDEAEVTRVKLQTSTTGARLIDCGIDVPGGLEAGRRMAQICLADLGWVDFAPPRAGLDAAASVMVMTDHPVAACMASQYAGWQVAEGKYFAMGSGPMRAAAGKEALFEKIGYLEQASAAVGVLETRQFPPDAVCLKLAAACHVDPQDLTLLLAPTASVAGTVQIVARSVETALHKLFELGFDLRRVASAVGCAPLPPASGDDLTAIGRTNDAILYGGEVTLWVHGDDASLQTVGPRVPSSGSADHGQPFAAIFKRYDHDFYKIDPHLFSPAVVTFTNLDTGSSFRFGQLLPSVINDSFAVRAPTS